MERINHDKQLNSGFTLVELLIAIAIISIMTVPLLSAFTISGRISRESRRMQNAINVASLVTENAKKQTNLDDLKMILNSMNASAVIREEVIPEDLPDYTEGSYRYVVKTTGSDGEEFLCILELVPKVEYNYSGMKFIDIYKDASVVYRDFILYDETYIADMLTSDVDYDNSTVYKLVIDPLTNAPMLDDSSNVIWTPYAMTDADKNLLKTYQMLFEQEVLDSDIPAEFSALSATTVNDDFKHNNINKYVNMNISKVGLTFEVNSTTEFVFPDDTVANDEFVMMFKADLEGGADDYYLFIGKLSYQYPAFKTLYDCKLPIYMLYSKPYPSSDPSLPSSDPRMFNLTEYNITFDNVAVTNESGAAMPIELTLVEQGEHHYYDNFVINLEAVNSGGIISMVKAVTNEDMSNVLRQTIKNLSAGNVVVTSSLSDPDAHIAYSNVSSTPLIALYDISVNVLYDMDKNGSYDPVKESVYSVITVK